MYQPRKPWGIFPRPEEPNLAQSTRDTREDLLVRFDHVREAAVAGVLQSHLDEANGFGAASLAQLSKAFARQRLRASVVIHLPKARGRSCSMSPPSMANGVGADTCRSPRCRDADGCLLPGRRDSTTGLPGLGEGGEVGAAGPDGSGEPLPKNRTDHRAAFEESGSRRFERLPSSSISPSAMRREAISNTKLDFQ
jgi:hypothetical protein